MAGGKWSVVLPIVFLVLAATAQGRSVPNEIKGDLNDQKNLITFGGIGVYSGIGSNGLPVGGFGGGAGIIGDPSLGGLGGGGVGRPTAPFGGFGGGGVTGAGTGLGNGGFPFP